MISTELESLVASAGRLEKWPLAKLISLFETETEESKQSRQQVMSYLQAQHKDGPGGFVLGITGTPGAGKSSLIGELCLSLLASADGLSVAVLAVDPSSQLSGGALLGDRTRTQLPVSNPRIFFRSQASDLDLGGVGRKTFQVVRLLRYFFDLVIIETVGIGQSEVEVKTLSDHTVLVMQPLAGDQVQFMKAGVMEVPDTFVVNKCDEDSLAKKSYHLLKSSLKLVHIYVGAEGDGNKQIFLTSALKQKGIGELADFVMSQISLAGNRQSLQNLEAYYLKKQVARVYGTYGLAVLERYEKSGLSMLKTFEEKEQAIFQLLGAALPAVDSYCQV
jgi:LAO/AO transport system kinase